MKRSYLLRLAVGLAAVACLAAAPARAGLDVSFGADVPVGDDARLFFNISSRYFDRDVRVIEDYSRRYYPNPDDLSVALFLSSQCDRGPEWFFSLRKEGLGWFEIGNRCHVPVDVWFVPVAYDPGPPYGKAYGHWKNHKKHRGAPVVLTDDDCRNLVAVRVAHEYYGVPVKTAMQWRASGMRVDRVMAGEYRKRHGQEGHATGSTSAKNTAPAGSSKSKGNQGKQGGKGNGKGHNDR